VEHPEALKLIGFFHGTSLNGAEESLRPFWVVVLDGLVPRLNHGTCGGENPKDRSIVVSRETYGRLSKFVKRVRFSHQWKAPVPQQTRI
jgi:hypothetical protein